MSEIVSIEATIRGRVQGVWYRRWTKSEATHRGIDGWVENRADGTVKALFVGPRADVDDMLAACRDGPPDARVDAVETREVETPAETRGFLVLS